MKKITEITKNTVVEIRTLIQDKLDELKSLGISISLGNIRYDADTLNTKLTLNVVSTEQETMSSFEKRLLPFEKAS